TGRSTPCSTRRILYASSVRRAARIRTRSKSRSLAGRRRSMHRFQYKGKELFCESVPVSRVAGSVGTPFYLYSVNTFLDHYDKLAKAFKSVPTTICFSMKANSNLTILKALVNRGAGLDIVSGGELYRAKKVGVAANKIVFASVGKTEAE